MRLCFPLLFSLLLTVHLSHSTLHAEEWTISVTYELNTNVQGISSKHSARGKARIRSFADGTFTGNGTMQASYFMRGNNMTTNIKGEGSFQVKAKADGKYLLFSFDEGAVPMKGIMVVGGMKMSHQDTFNPATIAPVHKAHSIERREGEKAEVRINSGGVNSLATFTLSGGNNVTPLPKEKTKKLKNVPRSKDKWTLLFHSHSTMAHPFGGTMSTKMSGEVDFHPPRKEGPVRNEGPYRCVGNNTQMIGRLILDGRVENDRLYFVPKAQVTKVNGQTLGGSAQSNFNSGLSIFKSEEISLPLEHDAKLEFPFEMASPPTKGKTVWQLKGKKREKWQITIDDKNHEYAVNDGSGAYPRRCGLVVRFRRTIIVEIENGTVKSVFGTSKFLSKTPFSTPTWAYKCSSEKMDIYGTGTDIEANRYDQVRHVGRFNPPKNAKDAKLKKEWESIKKRKTPYAFPEKFTPGTNKVGQTLTLNIPTPTGYCVGIRAQLQVKEVIKRGYQQKFKGKRRDFKDTERRVLQPKFTVQLKDGYHQKSPGSDAISSTEVRVKKLSSR